MPRLVESADPAISESDGLGFYRWDVEADVLHWSRSLLKIYGLKSAPESEHGFYALLHPEDRVRVEAETTAYLQSGDRYEHCFRIIRPDGQVRTILDRGTIARHADGTVDHLRGFNIDITDAKAEAAISKYAVTRNPFLVLANNIDQLAWIANASGWIYWYNQRWLDYTGTRLEEMAGWGWRRVHHPDHVDRVVEKISKSFATGEPWQDVFPLKRSDGEYRWFLSRALPVRDDSGAILHWFGTNTDITEQRRNEAQFRALAESVPQLVWSSTAEGEVDYYNSRIGRYSSAKDPNGRWAWPLLLHPDDLAETVLKWNACAAEGKDYSHYHRLRMADGRYRWHLSRGVPLKDEDGRLEKWFGTATDVHELKQNDEIRGVLLAEANHRIKNIVAMIKSLARLSMRSSQAGDEQRFSKFFELLGAFSAAHTLTISGTTESTSLFAIIDGVTRACGVTPEDLVRTGDDISVASHAALMLSLGFHELCTNAAKYGALSSAQGKVRIQLKRLDDGQIQLRWEETGGPVVVQPTVRGLGSQLLERTLAETIKGRVELQFNPPGLVCVIEGAFGGG